MEQALNELGDMIRKQQQLRDKTFKQGQDSRRDRRRGKQGNDQSMGDLQQDQQGLRDRLKKLQEELAKRGMGQRAKGQKGDQGQPGADQGDDEDGLGEADGAMGDAGSRLGEGNADGAVGLAGQGAGSAAQGRAEPCGRHAAGRRRRPGRPRRPHRPPAGRPQRHRSARPSAARARYDELSKMIPGEMDVQRVRRILEELRRRLADPSRPQIELDYIERLLKDY